ncbi:hypothetical protein D3C73_1420230 [compost metagenome]
MPFALAARLRAHKLLDEFTYSIGSRIPEAPLQIMNDAFKGNHSILLLSKVVLILETDFLSAGSVHNDFHLLAGQLIHRNVHRNAIVPAG